MLLAALVAGAGAAGCGGDEKADGSPVTTSASPTGPAPIDILVTNDDGVGAAGIDAVVNGLKALPAVTVTVVAPAANQSGSGGKTTQPTPPHHDAATASGVAATAVDGFPADSVLVALDVLGLKPDVVVSGINQGQNLGPVVDLSGTVGAARAAASRGIPAIATSLGLADSYDYSAGVTLVVDWVTKHRAEFADTATSARTQESLANLNIPNCAAGGKLRGLKQLPTQTAPDLNSAIAAGAISKQDCSSTAEPAEEVPVFNAGYATLTDIPVAPSPSPSSSASAAPAAVPSPTAS